MEKIMSNLSISFAITVCNEVDELERLLDIIEEVGTSSDEVVVQCDKDKVTQEVLDLLSSFEGEIGSMPLRYHQFPLAGDFSSFKNNLKKNCYKKWIFQIDADEELNQGLVENLHELLESNDHIDIFRVPRVNIVKDITRKHFQQWGWRWSTSPDYTSFGEYPATDPQYLFYKENNLIKEELFAQPVNDILTVGIEYYTPIINFPDYQMRILKNDPLIEWKNKVHEVLGSTKKDLNIGELPAEAPWSLLHVKSIDKQENQNKFYSNLL